MSAGGPYSVDQLDVLNIILSSTENGMQRTGKFLSVCSIIWRMPICIDSSLLKW